LQEGKKKREETEFHGRRGELKRSLADAKEETKSNRVSKRSMRKSINGKEKRFSEK